MVSAPTDSAALSRDLLILEPIAEGHSVEWLQHLMRAAALLNDARRVWFVVPSELYSTLSESLSDEARNRVRVVPMRPHEAHLCRHRLLPVSGFARWHTMRRYLGATGAAVGHFLSLDHLTLPLALGLGARGRPIGGILFRPSVHYGTLGPDRPTLRERVRDIRKAVLYRRMLRNRTLGTVLTLDPYFPRYAERSYPQGGKVRALCDPAFPVRAPAAADHVVANAFPNDRVAFLLFGYLTERKGIFTLLDALARLRRPLAARTAVMIAGKVEPSIRAKVAARCDALQAARPDLWLRLEDRWIGSGELEALVRRCDVVLAPYHRFVGSSGAIMWAARSGKPVLAQEYGLIGRLVRDHALGLDVNTSEPAALTDAIGQMVERGPAQFIDPAAAAAFAANRTPERFAAAILESLLHD